MTIPRIVIAGTHSGCGKTTVAGGLMGALVAKGYRVQPFKVGPDFIDPSHHSRICGRESRNLDPFMMGETGCRDTFLRASETSDVAIIEGVMGMFDGVDGTDLASTAHVARILQAPVILVVDAKGMSRSIHALIRGFREFDPTVSIAGVIVNRTGSPRHRAMIEPFLALPALGWLPRSDEIAVKSRHLGLVMGHEPAPHREIAALIAEHCNLDAIILAARAAPPLPATAHADIKVAPGSRIGIAYDKAFCFYYRDNLDLLERSGAELVFFSALTDHLPSVDAVYIGGGYPELFLPNLASASCTMELKKAAGDNLPILGECGGLMYLARDVLGEANHRMTGILPASATMTKRVQALGYTKGTITSKGAGFLTPGQTITGHEFHYSQLDPDRDARFTITLSRGKGIFNGRDGLVSLNALGQYTHAYFSPEFARCFVDAAVSFSRT
ncbi:cobyrinate a,c-diamide synthase [Methanoregula sp.]|uniref:cobyrinate a,c-diamide synthase n=1 Tax=Methanoregula sp. TaxID=2052170 RepID=UPI002615E38F|nr:cobyrinate a,c-diamide synthase [Methanoregula sp.]MDD5141877.1 cobyrinate a,c-diamide synthase [Methanoregula sp.]